MSKGGKSTFRRSNHGQRNRMPPQIQTGSNAIFAGAFAGMFKQRRRAKHQAHLAELRSQVVKPGDVPVEEASPVIPQQERRSSTKAQRARADRERMRGQQ